MEEGRKGKYISYIWRSIQYDGEFLKMDFGEQLLRGASDAQPSSKSAYRTSLL